MIMIFEMVAVSGAVCASTLARNGVSVTLFESARGPGGRMSQRRFFSFFFYLMGFSLIILIFVWFSILYLLNWCCQSRVTENSSL